MICKKIDPCAWYEVKRSLSNNDPVQLTHSLRHRKWGGCLILTSRDSASVNCFHYDSSGINRLTTVELWPHATEAARREPPHIYHCPPSVISLQLVGIHTTPHRWYHTNHMYLAPQRVITRLHLVGFFLWDGRTCLQHSSMSITTVQTVYAHLSGVINKRSNCHYCCTITC